MNIIPWKHKGTAIPVSRVAPFGTDFDQLVGRFFGDGWPASSPGEPFRFAPSMDVAENDGEISVRVELPGMDAEQIEIQVSDGVLTITGEKTETTESEKDNVFHAERRFGSFKRSVQLPSHVDAGKVTADYDKGVLTVHLPRTEASQPKRIEVAARG